ncbi:lysM and putative peptidoglycan-binding domain-containing protein 3 [Biomphalaria glabrata]|nr:lysM and putative peptidoglycan-binding domain-containing protein 3 [Biomphalaria glabrata]
MARYVRGIPNPINDKRQMSSGSYVSFDQNKKSRNKNVKSQDGLGQGYKNGTKLKNIKAARVYVFGDSNINDDDDENVEFEMRSRHKKGLNIVADKERAPEYFEKEISEGETLQAIALKYACQVSEIKRINNLIQDQEFYGLKVIKVPMTQYGILSEQFGNRSQIVRQDRHSTSHVESSSDYDDMYGRQYEESDSQHDFSDPDTQIHILRTLSIRDNFAAHDKEAQKFLQKMDEDLKKFKQNSRQHKESLTEVISVLTNKSIHPLASSLPSKRHNGADCGISWWSVLIALIVIAILVPLLALIYYFYFHESKHSG